MSTPPPDLRDRLLDGLRASDLDGGTDLHACAAEYQRGRRAANISAGHTAAGGNQHPDRPATAYAAGGERRDGDPESDAAAGYRYP